ncbi:M20 family metallo-hydrolase [Halalkalibacter oceani]|uniref:M20 family metallo-hydrolase n=1 Tax=Halalkalibacter oceani TaxID=1653776 RepID=UPI0033938A3B
MQTFYKINSKRVYSRIMELAEIGKVGDTGVKRPALTKEDKEGQLLATKWMEEAGLTVSHDHFGNVIGRKEGKDPSLPSVMLGSHIDSVLNGGRFDGIIGVIGAIEVVQTITDENISHDHPIEVVAFCEEEGSRFNDGLFGSRGMIGQIDVGSLKKRVDDNGISRYEALKTFGFGIDPDKINESVRKKNEIKLFLEMHIEQGPYLDETNQPVGIVKGIAGPAWYTISLEGVAGHAGTVPMGMRQDPMVGAAEIITEIEKICKQDPEADTVATVGRIQSFPGGSNIIPAKVEFSLDLRDIDRERRQNRYDEIKEKIKNVCAARKLSYSIETNMEIDPVPCSEKLVKTFLDVSKAKGINAPIMISGAGHDAMLMAAITDIGMVFVRCKDGISHQPNEFATEEDIAIGTELLLEAVLQHI